MTQKVRCSMMDDCANPLCHHYHPHDALHTCGSNWCEPVDDTPRCEGYHQHADAISLADMVLEWWEDARYTMVRSGDEGYDNLYDEEPDFVREARKIKKEVTIV